jgi:hypothetical protein
MNNWDLLTASSPAEQQKLLENTGIANSSGVGIALVKSILKKTTSKADVQEWVQNRKNTRIQYLIDNHDPYPHGQRRGTPKNLREKIFARDGHKCQACDEGGTLHCDHIIPYSRGGPTEESNLQTLCATCNLIKRNRIMSLAEVRSAKEARDTQLQEA